MIMGLIHPKPRLKDVIENPLKGIFYALDNFPVPWQGVDVTSITEELDTYYLYVSSGEKQISDLVTFYLSDGVITDENMYRLAHIIWVLYGAKWEKEYDTMQLTYDPISNYDMEEKMINDTTQRTHTDNDTLTLDTEHTIKYGKTETTTNNLQSTLQHGKSDTTTNNLQTEENNTSTTEKSVMGFNSTEYVPSEKEEHTGDKTTTNTGTQTIASSGTDTERDTGTQGIVTSGTDTESDTGTHTTQRTGNAQDVRNYTLTRKGNIGVTTSQQMLESERKLWLWDYFQTVVFPDINKAMTIPYYGGVSAYN